MSQARFATGQPGVHCVGPADRNALLAQMDRSQQAFIRIDLSRAHDKPAVMAALAAALHLPDYFGGNLDALADCLNDPDHAPAGVVLLEGLTDRPGLIRDDLLEVFEDAVAARAACQTPFWVYWMGMQT